MHTHQASCLRGPITQGRTCWPRIGEEAIPDMYDPDIRTDLVQRLRLEIANGTYETPDKLDAALDRLLDGLQ